jgi:hypothetical protein
MYSHLQLVIILMRAAVTAAVTDYWMVAFDYKR